MTQNGRKKTMTKYEIGATKLANRFTETADPKIFLMISKVIGSSPAQAYCRRGGGCITCHLQHPTKLNMLDWYLPEATA